MNKYKIVQRIEEFAPLKTQEKWDASGWIVDLPVENVNKIMFALTITDSVFKQAIEQNCDMIISHHPLFFVPFEYKKINMYCAHTNLDRAEGGTTDLIIQKLEFEKNRNEDFVRIVELKTPISVEELRERLLKISPNLRYVNNNNMKTVQTIGFCAGSGAEFINQSQTDAFVTGDLKFHTALDAKQVVFDIGHFESEIFAPELLMKLALGEETLSLALPAGEGMTKTCELVDISPCTSHFQTCDNNVLEVGNKISPQGEGASVQGQIIGVLANEKSPFI